MAITEAVLEALADLAALTASATEAVDAACALAVAFAAFLAAVLPTALVRLAPKSVVLLKAAAACAPNDFSTAFAISAWLLAAKPKTTMMKVSRPKMVLKGHLHKPAHLGIAQKQHATTVHMSLTRVQ